MKTRSILIACLLAIGLTTNNVIAQGGLTPSGAPAPTMKTMQQVEPRTPIYSVPYTITQSGSYYLTTSLTAGAGEDGITVNADNVTIEMAGFTLAGSGAGSGFGIYQSDANQNLRVTNGKLVGWQGSDKAGIYADGYNNQVSNIQASQNHHGIQMGPAAVIADCSAHENDVDGIWADDGSVINGCNVNENGGNGIFTSYGTISACSARWNVGNGIYANGNSSVAGCSAFGNHAKGINAGFGSMVSECQASANWEGGIYGTKSTEIRNCTSSIDFFAGIEAGTNCTLVGNTCSRNGRIAGDAAGILVTGHDNRIESNHVIDNDRGLDIDAAGNYVANNTVKSNDDNYDIVQGNQLNILLCEVPESIDWPASVRFAGKLECTDTATNAISVNATDVQIDMDGHSLTGPASGDTIGIYIGDSMHRASVINGVIRKFKAGVYSATGPPAEGCLFKEVAVSECSSWGIFSGISAVIQNCRANSNQGSGIVTLGGSTLLGCVAENNQLDGINTGFGSSLIGCTARNNQGMNAIYVGPGSSLSQCTAYYNQGAYAIHSYGSATIDSCVVYQNQGIGIYATTGSTVMNCSARINKSDGIRVSSGCLVSGNTCTGNGLDGSGAGICAVNTDSRIENNNVVDNDYGIKVTSAGNLIIKNSASGNTTNYDIVASNVVGVVVSATISGAVVGDSGGVGIGTSGSWANITY